ncbi:phage tail tape measure protein [Streptomyces turgidiscabies]|uniref:phage tail tape measure protein n=1 Tax=Streptomyces turgidiscabies TaxID=85558 RepID=UPI0038F6668A
MAANSISILITAKDQASNTLRGVANEMDKGSASSGKFGSALAAVGNMARTAALAAGTAAVAASGFAVSSAADYEQSLNIFRSVSDATAQDMEKVAATARQLGQDAALPGISAKDAALAMVELSKAGLSVNDTLSASKGVLALAKAGNLDTAAAAEVAANALNAFKLEGKEASRVADLLAAAANASSAGVNDLAFGLQMSSAQAASVKVPLEDLTTMLAEMANNGLRGSDAGTSLKTMFMNLIPTTDKARASMAALNLDFYDAKGNFVGTRELIKQLQEGTKDLTDEQKALHIETIFGSDSSRAVNILMKEGVEGYDKLSKAVNKNGAAVTMAAAQNAGFKGSLDALKSSLETVAIDAGMVMLPALTKVATTLSSKVEPAFDTLKKVAGQAFEFLGPAASGLGDAIMNGLLPALKAAAKSDFARIVGGAFVVALYAATRVVEGATRALGSLIGQVSQMTPLLVLLGAGFVTYQTVVAAATVKTTALAVAQGALNTAMKLNPYALVAGAAIGIVAAYTQVVTTSSRTAIATDMLKAAQDRLKQSTDAAKLSQDQLSQAYLTLEGASLSVERAQQSYNEAVRQYGVDSLPAREAAYALKRAQDDLARANADVAARTEDARKAEAEKKKASEEVVKALDATKDAANRAAGGYQALSSAIREAREEDKKTGVNNGFQGKNQTNAVFGIPGRAIGTPYAPGGRTLVGENGPEIVDLPTGSRVTQAFKTRTILSEGTGSGVSLTIENMNINNGGDVHRMLSDIGFALRLAS